MTGPAPRADIGAVVVLFDPESAVFDNVRSYAGQVGQMVAVDNTPTPDPRTAKRLADDGVEYIALGDNEGIAKALNVGCDSLRGKGLRWALTMDQDSRTPPDFVAGLARCLETGADDVAVVAPLWEQVGGLAETSSAECKELDWAMTSGNLLRLEAHKAVDGFREALFIDQVDNELCFRLRVAGWRILQSHAAVLEHRQGKLRRTSLGFFVTDYPPTRRYYMTRNTLLVKREYGDRFPAWVSAESDQWRRDIPKMLLGEPERLSKARMIYRGWRDARAGRLGKYEELYP